MWRESLVLFFISVLALAGSAGAQIDPDLVGWWKLDETSGSILDSSGNGNHGTIESNPTPVAGVMGGAWEFHGTGAADNGGDRINVAHSDSLDITSNISIAMWIKPEADDPEGTAMNTAPLCKALNGASPSWSFQVRYGWGATEPYMAFTFNTSPRAWAFVGQNLEKDEWCHIACSHDGATLKCYLNGQETDSTAMGAITSSPTPVLIGSDGWGSDWIGAIDDVRIYKRGLTPEEITEVMLSQAELATDPSPIDQATDVPRDVVLSWIAGQYAATHDVYFGTVADDVNDASRDNPMGVLVSQGQAGTSYDPDIPLDFETTYYWRIDEVNAAPDFAIFKGDLWSFTTEPIAYEIENVVATSNTTWTEGQGPDRLVDGSGLNANGQHSTDTTDMWAGTPNPNEPSYVQFEFDKIYKLHEMRIWNYNFSFEMFLGFGVKEATIEYSEDGVDWNLLGDVELAQAPGVTTYTYGSVVDFEGLTAQYVRMTIGSSWNAAATSHGLSEVRFMYIPVQAREPKPTDGATNVAMDATLSWRPGRQAATHEIYLGTDPADLALAATTTQSSYSPDLNLDTLYYWQIVEVNEAEAVPAWASDIWSFSTQEYIEVDGFETYDDDIDAGTAIWQTWIDGIDDSTNGEGVVGYGQSPFAEQTIVHTGNQSMPFSFNNGSASAISEADRTLSPAQNWTSDGIKTLSLWFYGVDGNAGRLYVKINGTKIVYDGDTSNIANPVWQPWNIDLASAGVTVNNVTMLSIGVEGVGSGQLFIDDIRLYAKTVEIITPTEPDTANLVGSWPFDGNVNDASGKGHHGTLVGTGITYGNDPVRGQVLDLPGGDDIYVSIGSVGISGTMPRTIACWAKADNTTIPDWTLIFGFTGTDTSEGGNGSHFNIGSLGGPGGVGAHCWGWEETIFSDTEALEWHHYAMSYDGTTIRYYGDGQPMDTDPAKSNVQDLSISADRVHVGSRITQTSSFPGLVDDAAIYNVQLTDGQVAWLAGRRGTVYKAF